MQIRPRIAAAVAVAISTLSLPAFADPPATANSIRVGLGFRYGFGLNDADFNPWGTGLGVEAGYTLPNAIYLGGSFDYFFGKKVENAGGSVSGNLWQIMAEGGYDLGLGGNVVIRPKVGIGTASLMNEVCLPPAGCSSNSETDLAVAPGATFIVIASKFSVSLDFRYDLVFADAETAKALIFSAGIGR